MTIGAPLDGSSCNHRRWVSPLSRTTACQPSEARRRSALASLPSSSRQGREIVVQVAAVALSTVGSTSGDQKMVWMRYVRSGSAAKGKPPSLSKFAAYRKNRSAVLQPAMIFAVIGIAAKELPSEIGGFGVLHDCVGFRRSPIRLRHRTLFPCLVLPLHDGRGAPNDTHHTDLAAFAA